MAFNSPILGPLGVGMIGDDGKLTPAAREAFVAQVILLLVGGNLDGKGPKISSIVGIPFPPIPGPGLVDPDRLLTKPKDPIGKLFWFDPSPLAAVMSPVLIDPEKDYQKIIVNNLYEPLVKMMNVKGNVLAPPLFDPTCFFEIDVDIEEFWAAINLVLPDPKLWPAFVAKYDINLDTFKSFALQLPQIPAALPLPPPLPIPPIPDFDFIIFPDLFLGILGLPLEILKPDFVISLVTIPVPDPIEIFLKIAEITIQLVIKLLETIGLLAILPKLLSATMIVMLQNLVCMMVCDIIGSILGTGQVVKLAGRLLGLSS